MSSMAHALAREELIRVLTVFQGITTTNGNPARTSLIDAVLIGANDFITGKTILIGSGNSQNEDKAALGFNPLTGEINVVSAFNFQILAGTTYKILNISSIELEIFNILANVGDPSGHTLPSLTDKWGDIARSLTLILGARWDLAGDLGTDIAAILASLPPVAPLLVEQPETAVNINAIVAAETNFLNLAAPLTQYVVRDATLKCADPGVNTVVVRLYKLVNGVLTLVDTFNITAANFATFHSLMDMFGRPHLAGDRIQITVQASAGGPYAVTGSYSHAIA